MFLSLEWYEIGLIALGVLVIGIAKLYAFKKMKDKKAAQMAFKQQQEEEE